MKKNSKKTGVIHRLLVLALVVLLTALAVPAYAETSNEDGIQKGPKTNYLNSLNDSEKEVVADNSIVHKDPATFEKNFCLTPAQKEYTITKMRNVVSKIIDPDMSDLEKYYHLAIWENKHAKYDPDFWMGKYDFSCYRHQWDSYGVLTEKSVCVGMAITYSVLCHAAGLPCKFVRCDPVQMDHTISYIPDINGNAYFVDVTEDCLFMSKYANFFEPMDLAFSNITKECKDKSFEYEKKGFIYDEEYSYIQPSSIKECYYMPFADWYREYALHDEKITDKKFQGTYVENGSGLRADQVGYKHASYDDFENYPAQPYASRPDDSAVTGIWFLDDFYTDPAKAQDAILKKEFDKQFLDISGLKDGYGYYTAGTIKDAIAKDLIVRYFPSSEDGKVVPWADDLKTDVDYKVKCKSIDKSKKKAVIAIESTGKGGYTGSYQFTIKLKDKNPMKLKGKIVTVKYSKLKAKPQTIKRSKAINVNNAKGKVSYELFSAKKGKTNCTNKFKINENTGNITVQKNLKKGNYTVKIQARAAGNSKYGASSWEEVTFKVKIK